jgi:hypothetical protein
MLSRLIAQTVGLTAVEVSRHSESDCCCHDESSYNWHCHWGIHITSCNRTQQQKTHSQRTHVGAKARGVSHVLLPLYVIGMLGEQ